MQIHFTRDEDGICILLSEDISYVYVIFYQAGVFYIKHEHVTSAENKLEFEVHILLHLLYLSKKYYNDLEYFPNILDKLATFLQSEPLVIQYLIKEHPLMSP